MSRFVVLKYHPSKTTYILLRREYVLISVKFLFGKKWWHRYNIYKVYLYSVFSTLCIWRFRLEVSSKYCMCQTIFCFLQLEDNSWGLWNLLLLVLNGPTPAEKKKDPFRPCIDTKQSNNSHYHHRIFCLSAFYKSTKIGQRQEYINYRV